MKKWTCIKCGKKEIPQYTEYCDECEKGSFKKIGGWLILPALSLLFMLISGLLNIYQTLIEVIPIYSNITTMGRYFVGLGFALDLALFVLIVITTIFFFQKRKKTPTLYISLLIANIATQGLMILLMDNVFKLPIESEYTFDIIRSIFHAVIWVSYFKISVRVKKTFVN
ncbi:DUF2569 domain-containing protein [Proteus sp. FME41]|uniref:DUF2569 domain-containing protein n=1 Tax=Proteus sp. FME41 TaxID=2742608 RepID=UPI0018674F2E|nr:DUF2569 domain-containing protein [Proteus sp. FME41]